MPTPLERTPARGDRRVRSDEGGSEATRPAAADSVVPPEWLQSQLRRADEGYARPSAATA